MSCPDNHIQQGGFHVFCHFCRIAAHIDMRAFLRPLPKSFRLFADFVLHIDFFFLIAGPGEIVPVQEAVFGKLPPFGLIEEVGGKMRIAENQPVFAFRIFCGTLLDESAERCDAGAEPIITIGLRLSSS